MNLESVVIGFRLENNRFESLRTDNSLQEDGQDGHPRHVCGCAHWLKYIHENDNEKK